MVSLVGISGRVGTSPTFGGAASAIGLSTRTFVTVSAAGDATGESDTTGVGPTGTGVSAISELSVTIVSAACAGTVDAGGCLISLAL